jgi:hypothetical protein
MHETDLLDRGERSRFELETFVVRQGIPQQPVLGNWKLMAGGQRNIVVVGIPEPWQSSNR